MYELFTWNSSFIGFWFAGMSFIALSVILQNSERLLISIGASNDFFKAKYSMMYCSYIKNKCEYLKLCIIIKRFRILIITWIKNKPQLKYTHYAEWYFFFFQTQNDAQYISQPSNAFESDFIVFKESWLYIGTYNCLDHRHSVSSHFFDKVCDIHFACLFTNVILSVQRDIGSCPSYPCATMFKEHILKRLFLRNALWEILGFIRKLSLFFVLS